MPRRRISSIIQIRRPNWSSGDECEELGGRLDLGCMPPSTMDRPLSTFLVTAISRLRLGHKKQQGSFEPRTRLEGRTRISSVWNG